MPDTRKFNQEKNMIKRSFDITLDEKYRLRRHLEEQENQLIKLRLRAIYLYVSGLTIDEVTTRIGCSRSTLLRWYQAYQHRGIAGLADRRSGGNNAKLSNDQLVELQERLQTLTPRMVLGEKAATEQGEEWTVEDLYRVIKQWYGVVYQSRTSYYNLLANSEYS